MFPRGACYGHDQFWDIVLPLHACGESYRVIVHTQMYPGYDKIVAWWPRLGGFFRTVTYGLERTPLRALGLSHLLVVEKPPIFEIR